MVAKTLFILFLLHMCGLHNGWSSALFTSYMYILNPELITLTRTDRVNEIVPWLNCGYANFGLYFISGRSTVIGDRWRLYHLDI